MKRRDFLKLSGAGVPLIGLASCDGDDSGSQTEAPKYAANDVRSNQATRVLSKSGVLDYAMSTEYATFEVNGITLNNRTFNGKFPPDTLVAKPGDVLKIRFKNNFPASAEDDFHPHDINVPHGFNNVNLHTHGLNVSPEGNQDNVFLTFKPGDDEFLYEIRIPDDHPSGINWYHPHKHGSALHQLASGMAGFIMIEGGDDDLNNIPEVAAAETVELSLHELIIGLTEDNYGTVPGEGVAGQELTEEDPYARNPIYSLFTQRAVLQYTINGMAVDQGSLQSGATITPPEIRLRPGELQHWRFGLLCHLQTYRFTIEKDEANADGSYDRIPLRVAAWDGITAEEIEAYDELVMGPADRLDFLIKAPSEPGIYSFKMLYEQFGNFNNVNGANAIPIFDSSGNFLLFLPLFVTPGVGKSELTVFKVIIEGELNDMPLPASLNPPMARLPYIRDDEVAWREPRKIEFKVTGQVGFSMEGVSDNRKFYINNLHFNPNRVNQTMLLGTAEEWEISNIHEGDHQFLQINHPFHIHVNWFQVMEIHHPEVDADGNIVLRVERPNNGNGLWVETIDVPFGGKVVIRLRFEKFAGLHPMHCHVIAHEDEGMMHICEIVDPTPVHQKISALSGGVLKSTDLTERVTVAFPMAAFASDTTVAYAYQLDPEYEAGVNAAGEPLLGLERYFVLYKDEASELNGTATVTINFPLEVSSGATFDWETVNDHVRLYRSNADNTGWELVHQHVSAERVMADEHTGKGVLISKINNQDIQSRYFAVMAVQKTGPVEGPTDALGQIHARLSDIKGICKVSTKT